MDLQSGQSVLVAQDAGRQQRVEVVVGPQDGDEISVYPAAQDFLLDSARVRVCATVVVCVYGEARKHNIASMSMLFRVYYILYYAHKLRSRNKLPAQ